MTTIKLRRGDAADWTAENPVLADGEFGYEEDTRKFKIGDNVTPWNDLDYNSAEPDVPEIHIGPTAPDPAITKVWIRTST